MHLGLLRVRYMISLKLPFVNRWSAGIKKL